VSGAEVKLFEAGARLDDELAMTTLLAPVKDAAEIRDALKPGHSFFAQRFDSETGTARYLVSDGRKVRMYSLTGISALEAAAVGICCEGIQEWNLKAFGAAVERVFGDEGQRVQ
jgi:hypothetical protein